MSEPTWDEWIDAISSLPLGKATGPSGISNEMLKHIDDSLQQVIWKLVCACLRNNSIPDAWRLANIYPIPKPKPWEYRINNTRPITLLETTRKAFVSILNRRLSNIFVQHDVLKGNQFAGLPGKSTFEPIRILNEVIQDAQEDKKDLWLLSQDLSKAYDRVNIHILRHAFNRLKIPSNFTNTIISLFTNRKNSVFTAVGTTNPYDVLIGIDQGEVISPLLWCIYYDPLLCEINEHKLGYNMSVDIHDNIYDF
jgi:Reverse transcriptase (RNA-dependent DNA polymerase).